MFPLTMLKLLKPSKLKQPSAEDCRGQGPKSTETLWRRLARRSRGQGSLWGWHLPLDHTELDTRSPADAKDGYQAEKKC